jgi:hypothetical protein
MKRQLSKRLVVDTDIFAAATNKPATRAKICKRTLSLILSLCHKIVITDKLGEEHRRRNFPVWLRRWLVKMSDNGKLIKEVDLQTDRPKDLTHAINNSQLSASAKARMLKDEHLLDAALWTDKRILSMDNTVFNDFRELSNTVKKIGKILWLNPEIQTQECFSWLEASAPDKAEHRLGDI